MNIETYLHGECHIFALALHLELGYEMKFAIDEFDLELNCERLIHAFCIDGTNAIDIRGRMGINEILDEFDYNKPFFINVTSEKLINLINENFIHEPVNGQLKMVRRYIRDNVSKYK